MALNSNARTLNYTKHQFSQYFWKKKNKLTLIFFYLNTEQELIEYKMIRESVEIFISA